MFNAAKPDASELPSTGRLLRSTGIAAVVAAVILTTIVLPAEYGIDPTGAGALTGLTEMGRIKMQLAQEAAEEESAAEEAAAASAVEEAIVAPAPSAAPAAAAAAAADQSSPAVGRSDSLTIVLAPDDGHEVKLVMEAGAVARFTWFTDGPGLNYDTHADGEGIRYHGYEKGTNRERQEGQLTAAFTGAHGWFWRNRSGRTVTLTLQTSGDYSDVKQYQ
jgi:hypothetical protein